MAILPGFLRQRSLLPLREWRLLSSQISEVIQADLIQSKLAVAVAAEDDSPAIRRPVREKIGACVSRESHEARVAVLVTSLHDRQQNVRRLCARAIDSLRCLLKI